MTLARLLFFRGLLMAGIGLPAAAVTAQEAADEGEICGTPEWSVEAAASVESVIRSLRPAAERPAWSIPVAFHVLHSGGEGDVADSRIGEQIGSMNCAFGGTGFSFRLLRIDRTDHDTWYRTCAAQEAAVKGALAVDPTHVLNLYSCDYRVGSNIGGMARYPWDFPEASVMHGAMLNHMLVVGSSLPNYNVRGHSVVHEVGHYLGLWHTFQGGCSDGDLVADTPAQAAGLRDCRSGFNDTCPAPGLDDTLNFMNWGNDCRDHFTPGQAERMRSVVGSLKPGLGEGPG
jgi:hypothetical protein